jgi:NAD(P)-dependent dehydrogenase (short-subunit alcohol dehydrogenase family)
VTGHDVREIENAPGEPAENFYAVKGDMSDPEQIEACFKAAQDHFGQPVNMLIANAGVSDESHAWPIWKIPLDVWEKRYHNNVRGEQALHSFWLLKRGGDGNQELSR